MEICVIGNINTGEVKMFLEINQAMDFMEQDGNEHDWSMWGLYMISQV